MRKSMLVVLLVATVLVVDTEAKWFRRLGSKIKDGIKKVVGKVKDFVDKYGPVIGAVAGAVGKRSVLGPCEAQDERRLQEAALFVQQLQEACPTFGIDPDVGLTEEAVEYAFEISDEDGNGSLNEAELEYFENIIDTYEECVVLALGKRK